MSNKIEVLREQLKQNGEHRQFLLRALNEAEKERFRQNLLHFWRNCLWMEGKRSEQQL